MSRASVRRPKRQWISLCVTSLGTAWVIGFVVFASLLPNDPGSQTAEGTERTDAIIVLTGGSLRLEAGLALLEAGLADKLFVSGVHRGVDVAELLRLQTSAPDRLKCCITLGHDAADTIGNARETAVWVEENGLQSIRLVTAGYHMPRSLLEFQAAMPDVKLVPSSVLPDHVKTKEWYRFPGTAWLIAGEYTKFLIAWARLTLQKAASSLEGLVG